MPTPQGSVDGADRTGTSTPDNVIYLELPAQAALRASGLPGPSTFPSKMSPINDENEDNASDVSMSAETEDSDDDSEDYAHGAASIIISEDHTTLSLAPGQKRKMSLGQGVARGEDHKRIKLDLVADAALASHRNKEGHLHANRSFLPAEIWHQIFTFTSPRALGHLLQVNKVFRAYLDPSSSPVPHNVASLSISVAQMRTPEAIWQASRRLFLPGMPSPLQGLNELEMWRLACTAVCQFCRRKDQPVSPLSADMWHSGPGATGVSTIWPFAIRSCGSCLQQNTVKEIDLLLSSTPSPLLVALPFIFITDDIHVISSATLQNTHAPAQIAKIFFKPQVEDVEKEFYEIRTMGSGTAEEWLKGLDKRGKEKKNDAFKWERWEQLGGLRRMHISERALFQENVLQSKLTIANTSTASTEATKWSAGNTGSKHNGTSETTTQLGTHIPQADQAISAPFSLNTPPRFDSPAQTGFLNYPRPYQQPRHERTKEEVAELKAARRAEIERRCMLLDPPLTSAVLSHMGSFQAAIQIIKPLDDSAWEVLKPRLLSQREEAQQRENDLVAQSRVVQEKYDERRQLDVHLKEVKEVNDREWDDIQAPLRARINGYADEIIRDGWHGGEKVIKESSPRFAADVLIYVRKRFYAEVAKDEAAARAAAHEPKIDPPNGPFTQKLILENMKFVFDTKIKPLTEQFSKELFLCNGCENNFKFYGFEGVIQHYAAKHTSALSVGSIVVHWRAEWPEHPPFNPEPDVAINTFHSVAKSNTIFANGGMTSPLMHGFGGYPPVTGQTVAPPTQAHQQPTGFQQNPAPYYGHSQYSDQYPMAQAGPFIQPQVLPGQNSSFQGPQYQGSQAPGFPPYSGQGFPGQGFDGQYTNGASLTYESPHPSHVYPVPMVEQTGQIASQATPFQVHFNAGNYNSSQYNPPPRPTMPVRTEAYKAQLWDIAQTAREVWNLTAGIKDMPGSVRVHVILFHILHKSRAKYPDDPPLAMLIDGLSNNKDMRVVRNVNGLACRACKLTNGSTTSYKGSSKGSGTSEKKFFSLPQLLNHFQTTHIEGIESPIFDWTRDMLEIPDNARISTLARAQGMDEHKMRIFSEALPEAFRISPPRTDHGKPELPYTVYSHEDGDTTYGQLAPSRDEHEKFYSSETQGRYSGPGREQYDPSESSAGDFTRDDPIPVKSSRRPHFDNRQMEYREAAPIAYAERRQASPISVVRAMDEYGRHVIRDDGHSFSETPAHHRNPDAGYRDKRPRAPEVIPYDHHVPRIEHGYVREVSLPRLLAATNVGTRTNHVVHVASEPKPRSNPSRPVSHSSLAPRNQPSRAGPVDGGSEDGEVHGQPNSLQQDRRNFSAEADSAAERFLNDFQPGEGAEEYAKKAEEAERHNEENLRAGWESERIESMRRMYQPQEEQHQHTYERHEDEGRPNIISLQPTNRARTPEPLSSRARQERPVHQHYAEIYDYGDPYADSAVETSVPRTRSPDMDDHRYRPNDVVYRDEQHLIHGVHAPPTRIPRFETVRVENDRQRPTSPLYVKLGTHPGQYIDSPASRYSQQDPLYRTRSPQPSQEVSYQRIARPEYYRVYADEPRSRQMQQEEQIEYVKVVDPKGDYLVRRPIRREPEPVYATFEDGSFPARQAAYENRPPASRSDPAYDEEYDPRHPAPPPSTTIRQVRY